MLPGDRQYHDLQPRDYVCWKCRLGPYQVLLANPCATKLKGIDLWIHVSHLKRTPTPEWSSQLIEDLKLKISKQLKTTTRIFLPGLKRTTPDVDSSPKTLDQASHT